MVITNIRRVAVIGAGPAGAIATESLVKEGVFDEIRVFERKPVSGGTWVHTPNLTHRIPSLRALINNTADRSVAVPSQLPCKTARDENANSHQVRFSDSGVHNTLHSNLPPSTMCFTQEEIPAILSQQTLERYGPDAPFRHWPIIRQWVENIFTRGGHDKLVEFNTTVEKAEKRDQEWILTLRKEATDDTADQWWVEKFDAVVVASGHYNLPYIPDIPGLPEYEDKYPGAIRHSKHYRSTEEFRDQNVIVVGGSVSAFDALHEIRTVSHHPVIASLRKPLPGFGDVPFTHPHIQVKPPIARFDPATKSVEFADGTIANDIDVVLFATGYDFSFPFLGNVEISQRRIRGLYQHVFTTEDPTLAFVGMVSGGLTFRVFEWQAVAAARVLAGRATLPSQDTMKEWEKNRVAAFGDGLRFSNIAPDFEQYFEGLRRLAGDPAPNSTGRLLPVFEQGWADEFSTIIDARTRWWKKEAEKAREATST